MALLTRSGSLVQCPECGAPGPYNFRLEHRVSLKNQGNKRANAFDVVNTKAVYACAKCGHVIQDLNG